MGKEIAELFYNQCVGEYTGHMAMIPHNPVISSIFKACGISADGGYDKRKEFAAQLRKFAEALEDELKDREKLEQDSFV